jgi:hypothetical protein
MGGIASLTLRSCRGNGMNQLPAVRALKSVGSVRARMAVPAIVAGDTAARRFLEFFAATIRNRNTRMVYYRAVTDFFAWVDRHRIGQLMRKRCVRIWPIAFPTTWCRRPLLYWSGCP